MNNNNGQSSLLIWFVLILVFIAIYGVANSSSDDTYTSEDYYNEHPNGKSFEQWSDDQKALNDMRNYVEENN